MKPAEVVKVLVKRLNDLEERVAALEKGDEWNVDDPDLDPDQQHQSDDDLSDLEPDERAQVEAARQRLANDTGQAISPERHGVEPETIETEEGGVVIEVPPATEEQKKIREQYLPQLGLEHMVKTDPLELEELEHAWIIGGPVWLHAYDRDYVMSLPEEVRRAFVTDVQEQSQTWAQELARDILKDHGAGGPEITIQSLIAASRS